MKSSQEILDFVNKHIAAYDAIEERGKQFGKELNNSDLSSACAFEKVRDFIVGRR